MSEEPLQPARQQITNTEGPEEIRGSGWMLAQEIVTTAGGAGGAVAGAKAIKDWISGSSDAPAPSQPPRGSSGQKGSES